MNQSSDLYYGAEIHHQERDLEAIRGTFYTTLSVGLDARLRPTHYTHSRYS